MTSGSDFGHTYSKLCRISGEDATPAQVGSYHAKTNFVVDFGYPLQTVKRVSVINVSFMNTIFNVTDSPPEVRNNRFEIAWNNGGPIIVHPYTIDPGFYNVSQLIDVLNAAIVDFKTTYAPLANDAKFIAPTTGKVVIDYGTGNNVNTVFQVLDLKFGQGPVNLLGFTSPISGEGVNPPNQTAENLPSLQGLTDIYVVSAALAPGNAFDEKTNTRNILVATPVTVPFGTLNVMECKQDVLCEVTYPKGRNIQRADFSLQDRQGNLVNLNGANLRITLRVWYDTT